MLSLFFLLAATPPVLPSVVQREGAEHYVWGQVNEGWHLVQRDDLSVISERLQPGTSEVRHHHARARQFFMVLSGELTMETGGETHHLVAGQGIEIAPGLPHQASNRSGAPVDILVTSAPKSHGDRIEDPAPSP